MTSVAPPDLHTSYASENKRASSLTLDADHSALEAWAAQLLAALGLVIRNDNTLADAVVRLRNLHPEVWGRFKVQRVTSFVRATTRWPDGKMAQDIGDGSLWVGDGSTQGGVPVSGPAGPPGPAGAGITDGDKGDVVVSETGATWLCPDITARLNALEYAAPDIYSLTNTTGTVEVGSTVTSVTLNWLLNKTMTTLSISSPGPGTITPSLLTYTIGGLSLTSQQSFTVTAGDGTNTDTSTTTVYFQHRRRWGESATETPDSTLIDALAGAEFSTSRVQTRTMSPSAKYLYFAWPSSFGTPTFTVNGLPVTGWVKTTVSYTNPSGNTTNFDVYRSQYLQTGSFTVAVT
jgi:hypothetical protein